MSLLKPKFRVTLVFSSGKEITVTAKEFSVTKEEGLLVTLTWCPAGRDKYSKLLFVKLSEIACIVCRPAYIWE